jgi:hypothetical protein
MSKELERQHGLEVKSEGSEAVAHIRGQVREILQPKIDELCVALEEAEKSKGELGQSAIRRFVELAESIFQAVTADTLEEELALLILKSTRLLRKGCDLPKIQAILNVAKLLQQESFEEFQIREADRKLVESELDILVEVPGIGELCGDGDDEAEPEN